jgi:hypothetical protein
MLLLSQGSSTTSTFSTTDANAKLSAATCKCSKIGTDSSTKEQQQQQQQSH